MAGIIIVILMALCYITCEVEVLAMVTGSNVPEEGDEVNLYHRVYTDKNGVKRHGFDVQINTGLASADELDLLFK